MTRAAIVRASARDFVAVQRRALLAEGPAMAAAIIDDVLAHPDGHTALAACFGLSPDGDIRTRAISLLAMGAWRAIEIEEAPRSGLPVVHDALATDDTPHLSDFRETDPTVTFGWISLEVVDHRGVPYADAELLFHQAGRGSDPIVLDAGGTWKARSLMKTGAPRVAFPKVREYSMKLRTVPPPGFARKSDDLYLGRIGVDEVTLPQFDRHYRIVVRPPRRPFST